MPASITGSLNPSSDTGSSSSGDITIEGDSISVAAQGGAPGTTTTKSPKNFIPILLVIFVAIAIWYYMKRKGAVTT